MKLASFKITSEQDGHYKHVFMDGKELPGVAAADVRLRVDELPTVSLVFNSLDIECDLDVAEICGTADNLQKYPVEVCKFYQKDGKCTELVDRICGFKKFDHDRFCYVCTKFKPEQDGEG